MKFTVQVSTKPYVKQYIENNCGSPANLSKAPDIKKYFDALMKIQCRRKEASIKDDSALYSETLTIVISQDQFYRHGWELTKTDTIAFNRFIENNIKIMMRMYIGSGYLLHIPLKSLILSFQDDFGFDETIWSYESIKKDFYRSGSHYVIDTDKKINKLFMEQVSLIRTKQTRKILSHENTLQRSF
jgi:hypothetical protein